jgi:hypothetical protein
MPKSKPVLKSKLNISSGVYFRIEGEVGKTQGLAWHVLAKMAESLQKLVIDLVRFDSKAPATLAQNSIEIELFDYKPGSAVPAFRVRKPDNPDLFASFEKAKTILDVQLQQVFEIAQTGNYDRLKNLSGNPGIVSELGRDVFEFVNSVGDSPLSIVKPIANGKFRKVYKITRFKKELYQTFVAPRILTVAVDAREEAFGKISVTKIKGKRKTAKLIEIYRGKDMAMSFAPNSIVTPDRVYNLHSPIMCLLHKEDDFFIIENEQMDLYASGETETQAEQNFYLEFDIAYRRFNDLPDDKLSERLKRAKLAMNLLVKEITVD